MTKKLKRPESQNTAKYQGLYFGEHSSKSTKRLRYKLSNLHAISFGAPGALKTAGLIIPNVAHLRQSMIIIDVKGQIAAITAKKREKMGRVIVLNPFEIFVKKLHRLKSHGWNPMWHLNIKKHFAKDTAAIADAISTKTAGSSSSFFDINAEKLISLFIMYERVKNGDKATLRNVYAALSAPTNYNAKKEPVSGFIYDLKRMSESKIFAIRVVANRIISRLDDPNTQQTSLQDVIDSALKDFGFLHDDQMDTDLQSGSIDWASLHREITTIYLILPVEDLDPNGAGKFLRLFVNLALRGLYQNPPTDGATLPRVLFILDEFAQLGRLKEIPKALGAARDYSIQMWFILQNLSQLKTHYKEEWPLFFTGSGVKTTFKCGDYETAEYFSKLIGNSERYVMTENQAGGTSLTPQAIPLIRPEDLMRLPPKTTVNLIDPCPYPIQAKVPLYKHTKWNDGLDPNPYYRE